MGSITALLARVFARRHKGGPTRRRGAAAELGAWGESVAERELRRKGYAVVARNMVTVAGEADLVCRGPDGRTMVIVEVKTRVVEREDGAFRPELAIHQAKRRKLTAVARCLARANGWADREVRVDVVAVERIGERVSVRHHEGIVRGIRPSAR